jgi:hypothetical protein
MSEKQLETDRVDDAEEVLDVVFPSAAETISPIQVMSLVVDPQRAAGADGSGNEFKTSDSILQALSVIVTRP